MGLVQMGLTDRNCARRINSDRCETQALQAKPEYAIMHDWWISLVASAFGHIGYIDEPLVLYRQHGSNVIGAKDTGSLRYRLQLALDGESVKRSLAQTYHQAEAFLRVYGDMLSVEQNRLVESYARIPQMRSKLRRALAACKLGTLKHGFARMIAQLWFI
jgi:hypothetical protein